MTTLVWPEIFFIRHGETHWNAERRYQGRRDIPLNATGEAQASQNGNTLRKLFEARAIDPTSLEWHASPLGRTRETMRRVRAAFPLHLPEVRYDIRLQEISFGELEGFLHDELPPDLAIAPGGRSEDYWLHRPRGGENYADVTERLEEFAGTLGGPSVIVAHGGIARTLRVLIERAPIVESLNWGAPQDAIFHFQSGVMEIITAADFAATES